VDITRLLVQIAVAIVCAGIATILVPRKIPGKFAGLILIGLTGVWVGEWAYFLFNQRFGLDWPILSWGVGGVRAIPAIVGSAIVLYVVTTFIRWSRWGA
jgi:uncharacterized membrane protein YeaQ/YmgE (transglycosylase-associated protein family)